LQEGQGLALTRALDAKMRRLFGRSLKLRQVSAGGCNACEADVNVLGTIVFDLGRFGVQFVASPRHADGLLITGPVTENMKPSCGAERLRALSAVDEVRPSFFLRILRPHEGVTFSHRPANYFESDLVTEEAWMASYASGDGRAFSRLFHTLAPRIHAFFLRSFHDRAVADDLMQTTFLKLHRARAGYNRKLPLRPWVFTIAASVRRDELRRRYRLPSMVSEDEWARLEPSVAADPADSGHGADEAEAVRVALERLPESQRVVLHLHRYEGLTFEQIADVLGTTPGAVRVRACRAYERLRGELEPLLTRSGAP
jgi:RNA polymerase sigma-70 factor, ECF subfamily